MTLYRILLIDGTNQKKLITKNKTMSYKVYEITLNGREMLAENVTYQETEILREFAKNLEFVDVDQAQVVKDLPEPESLEDDALCLSYGVDPRKLESAFILGLCVAIMPILLGLAWLLEK